MNDFSAISYWGPDLITTVLQVVIVFGALVASRNPSFRRAFYWIGLGAVLSVIGGCIGLLFDFDFYGQAHVLREGRKTILLMVRQPSEIASPVAFCIGILRLAGGMRALPSLPNFPEPNRIETPLRRRRISLLLGDSFGMRLIPILSLFAAIIVLVVYLVPAPDAESAPKAFAHGVGFVLPMAIASFFFAGGALFEIFLQVGKLGLRPTLMHPAIWLSALLLIPSAYMFAMTARVIMVFTL